MEKDDKGSTMIRVCVSGWMFLLVPAYPGCPGSKAVKRSLLLLLLPLIYKSETVPFEKPLHAWTSTDMERNSHTVVVSQYFVYLGSSVIIHDVLWKWVLKQQLIDFCDACVFRYMTQKLFAFAKGKCCAESCDNPMFQEVLLAGHLYQNVLKVRLFYMS